MADLSSVQHLHPQGSSMTVGDLHTMDSKTVHPPQKATTAATTKRRRSRPGEAAPKKYAQVGSKRPLVDKNDYTICENVSGMCTPYMEHYNNFSKYLHLTHLYPAVHTATGKHTMLAFLGTDKFFVEPIHQRLIKVFNNERKRDQMPEDNRCRVRDGDLDVIICYWPDDFLAKENLPKTPRASRTKKRKLDATDGDKETSDGPVAKRPRTTKKTKKTKTAAAPKKATLEFDLAPLATQYAFYDDALPSDNYMNGITTDSMPHDLVNDPDVDPARAVEGVFGDWDDDSSSQRSEPDADIDVEGIGAEVTDVSEVNMPIPLWYHAFAVKAHTEGMNSFHPRLQSILGDHQEKFMSDRISQKKAMDLLWYSPSGQFFVSALLFVLNDAAREKSEQLDAQ